jgi:hypothetical protein
MTTENSLFCVNNIFKICRFSINSVKLEGSLLAEVKWRNLTFSLGLSAQRERRIFVIYYRTRVTRAALECLTHVSKEKYEKNDIAKFVVMKEQQKRI